MQQSIDEIHYSSGRGIAIRWQSGPLHHQDGKRINPNGAFVEGVLQAAKGRLEHYQASEFACDWNKTAIDHISAALAALEARTLEREARGVEGTHEV